MFILHNENPNNNLVGDCVIRAIAKATDKSWEDIYVDICLQGFMMYDMPSSNNVWGTYLIEHNFDRYMIPNTCPHCYTIIDFCKDNPNGTFIVATGTHVVCIISGNYFDTWDSGHEIPLYFFKERSS
jgi:hypothetical protein